MSTNFDLTFLTEQVSGNPEALRDLVHLFCDSLIEGANAMEVALAQEDLKSLKEYAHRIKSSARALGVDELAEACAILQDNEHDTQSRRAEAVSTVRRLAATLPQQLSAAIKVDPSDRAQPEREKNA